MNQDLIPIIELAGSNGARVHIDSSLSTRDMSTKECEALVRSGLSSLFTSIAGVTQEVYELYRKRGKLDRVFRNVEGILAAKKRLRSKTPEIGWQFHVHSRNEHEIQAAIEKAKSLGIGIVFKRLNSPDPAWHSSIHDAGFMTLGDDRWFRQTYNPPVNPDFDGETLHSAVRSPCSQLFATMTIAWNGDVMPCTCVEGPSYVMGNLLETPLKEVWIGAEFAKSRRFVLNYGPVQNGGSVCERLECPIQCKSLVRSA